MKLIFGENCGNGKGEIPLCLIKGEILSLQKASAKQICFTSPKLEASLLLRDRLSPQILIDDSLVHVPTSCHMRATTDTLFSPHEIQL